HHHSDKSLDNLAETYNPYIKGWINYFGHFYREQLRATLLRIDAYLIRWARRKFKRLRGRSRGAKQWLARVRRVRPTLFPHWRVFNVAAEHRKPCELRGSRTVLGARGGESPPRDSPQQQTLIR